MKSNFIIVNYFVSNRLYFLSLACSTVSLYFVIMQNWPFVFCSSSSYVDLGLGQLTFHPSGAGKSSRVKAGHIHLCLVAGNTVWSYLTGDATSIALRWVSVKSYSTFLIFLNCCCALVYICSDSVTFIITGVCWLSAVVWLPWSPCTQRWHKSGAYALKRLIITYRHSPFTTMMLTWLCSDKTPTLSYL